MAFSSTIVGRTVWGNMRVVYGTYTNGATDSGGTITTGLDTIFGIADAVSSHTDATQSKATISNGVITLVTPTGVSGNFTVWGI